MTPEQYYFPYFFNQKELNKSIRKIGLNTLVKFDIKTKMAKELIITKKREFKFFWSSEEKNLLSIPFGTSLMIIDNEIIFWKTETDFIEISKANLLELENEPKIFNTKINISKLEIGQNIFNTELDLNNFVTFLRKDDLKYDQDYYENFVILIINKENVELVPFDTFNKKGGDYGYVWPAIARIDVGKKIIYGKGMRMSDFTIEL
ncbi:hypothetical protein [Flavobacterium sp.]|uniref:hypothetical protein n=1 Tax=Flavobacterium sp. TaxID=239 RepID=UPI003D2D5670